MEETNILVFPCASGIGQEIYKALKDHKDIKLYGLNSGENNIGYYLYKENYINAEKTMDQTEEFLKYLDEIVKKYKIQVIFPAYDDAHVFLRKHYKGSATVVTSNEETTMLCRYKSKTYRKFDRIICVPKMYSYEEAVEKLNQDQVLFMKQDDGEGSKNCFRLDGLTDLRNYYKDNFIITDYLPGEEFTIDCFTSKGNLLFSKARKRSFIKNGLSIITESVSNIIENEVEEMAKKINDTIELEGGWFFQVKYNEENKLCLLEIAPRIAGAMGLYRHLGINFPLLSIYTKLGKDVKINMIKDLDIKCCKINENYLIHNLFYENVYCDLDDTIIIKNKLNYKLIGLLYKFINEKKKVILLTRHRYNVFDTLKKHKISENIFDEIIVVPSNLKKAELMLENSILIDDSFEERKWCMTLNKKYAFDVDSIDIFF